MRIRNQASARLFKPFHRAYDMEAGIADSAMHVVFHPKGLRQFIVNWDEFAGQMIQILHREVAQGSAVAAACSTKSWPIRGYRPNGGCRAIRPDRPRS